MKTAKLLHNPKAGDEDHGTSDLVARIEAAGYQCRHSTSAESAAEARQEDVDLLVVAGGDGTVRGLTKELLERTLLDGSLPIALLPMGTANNISKTLEIPAEIDEAIAAWATGSYKKYDVGKVCNLEQVSFFLESFGYGLFPYLMQLMDKADDGETDTPEKKLRLALETLHEITLSYEPQECRIEVDGIDHSGRYLLVEVMNIRSIGPNLFLAPGGDPGDGMFDVVMLPESDRQRFADYISARLEGSEEDFAFASHPARAVTVSWNGTHVHADDEVVKIPANTEVVIELKPGLLEFLVPGKG